MTTINDIYAAYDEAQGQWFGCNWPTHYGSLGLDLESISASVAQQRAKRWHAIAEDRIAYGDITVGEEASLVDRAEYVRLRGGVVRLGEDQGCRLEVRGPMARRLCAGMLIDEWESVSRWLEAIESDAHRAAQEAQKAVSAAEEEDWEHALGHACQACYIESGYEAPRSWQSLKRAIKDAAR
jgi:hypothetical protein